jgi:small subunit ribosomal protein S3
MIETKFIKDIVREFQISEFISESLKNVGFSSAKLHKTPLGEKIIIYASRPGLIVGRKGENIQKLTKSLKIKFKLENPQIEIIEVEKPDLDPMIVAERIASSLERFGSSKFKGIGHKMLSSVMDAGAKGVEILISGKIPSSRAKRWRFYQGYLKKSGDVAISGVKSAYSQAQLKTGIVGIQVRIMPPDLELPDTITPYADEELLAQIKEEIKDGQIKEAKKQEKGKTEKTKKKTRKKKDQNPENKKEQIQKNEKSDKDKSISDKDKSECNISDDNNSDDKGATGRIDEVNTTPENN